MSLASLLKRGTAIVVVVLAILSVGASMSLVYRGGVVSLNAVGMMQHPLRTDFALYYRDSMVLRESPQHNPYDLATQRRVTAQLGIKRLKADPVIPSLSLPPLIWLVLPFTLFPLEVARWLWLALLSLCLITTWALAAPGKGLIKLAYLAAGVIFLPVSFAIAVGQSMLLVMAVVAIGWWLLKRGHEVWAGVIFSLIVVKPQIAFLVPVALLVGGRRKTLISFLAAASVIAAAVLLTVPLASLTEYASRLTQASHDPNLWRVNTTLTGVSQGGTVVAIIEATVACVIGAFAIRRIESSENRDDVVVVVGLLVSLLATTYLHYPDLTILVAAAWIYLRTAPPIWQQWLLLLWYWTTTMEPFGLPLTRTVEMVWLIGILQPPSPVIAWQVARAALERLSVQPSRAG